MTTQRPCVKPSKMVHFFSRHDYGPFKACQGLVLMEGKTFLCERYFRTGWGPQRREPPREASALYVHTDTLVVGFIMHAPEVGIEVRDMVLTFSIIVVMLFGGLALASVVAALAVRPLERRLGTVRLIANTVFKFSAESLEDAEATDIEISSEMILLERVVDSLAIIASLSVKEENIPNLQRDEDMQDEDLGVPGMMRGTNSGRTSPSTGSLDLARMARRSSPRRRTRTCCIVSRRPCRGNICRIYSTTLPTLWT
jgi:hypothetical protein